MSIDKETILRISHLIRSARRALGLTQIEMARALKVSQPGLSKIEAGHATPGLLVWSRFCRLADINPDVLVNEGLFNRTLAQFSGENGVEKLTPRSSLRKM